MNSVQSRVGVLRIDKVSRILLRVLEQSRFRDSRHSRKSPKRNLHPASVVCYFKRGYAWGGRRFGNFEASNSIDSSMTRGVTVFVVSGRLRWQQSTWCQTCSGTK